MDGRHFTFYVHTVNGVPFWRIESDRGSVLTRRIVGTEVSESFLSAIAREAVDRYGL